MAEQKQTDKKQEDQSKAQGGNGPKQQQPGVVPKTESSSEYEGADDRKPTGNQPVEEKVESSSESGQ